VPDITQIIYPARDDATCSSSRAKAIEEKLRPMFTNSPVIQTLDELRNYVNTTLCQHNQLEVGVFPMTERILVRADRPCGIYFCLHGPRAVTFSAIWETERNTVLFYGSTGQRFGKIQLVEAPRLEMAVA
jgi:hypothetical protein